MSNRLIRIKDVMDRTGLARSTVYKYNQPWAVPSAHQAGHSGRCLGRA